MTAEYPEIRFSSLDELCFLITRITSDWDTCWFRGCRSPDFSLLPTLFRDEFQCKREGYMSVEFRRRAHSRLRNITAGFDWLCAMQHYGLPTRLLDWSESLSVALYFSIGDIDWMEARPTIWVLDPFALASESAGESNIPIATSLRVAANADIAFQDEWEQSEPLITRLPLPVAPNFIFDRLSAQNGAFTIHGTDRRPLEVSIPETRRNALWKFVAHPDCTLNIVNCIRLIRPSPDAIFPDIDGMKYYVV